MKKVSPFFSHSKKFLTRPSISFNKTKDINILERSWNFIFEVLKSKNFSLKIKSDAIKYCGKLFSKMNEGYFNTIDAKLPTYKQMLSKWSYFANSNLFPFLFKLFDHQ